jgi:hypothetical protein
MGNIESMFVTSRSELAAAYDKEVYFGEVLGKHSEIQGTLEEHDITVVTDDQDFIAKLVGYVGHRVSGMCPLDYIQADE